MTRVNHATVAEMNGQTLNLTEVLIFDNLKVGTALMNSNQAIVLDLPIKVMAWEDDKGVVTIAYSDPSWMVSRYGIADRDKVVKNDRRTKQVYRRSGKLRK